MKNLKKWFGGLSTTSRIFVVSLAILLPTVAVAGIAIPGYRVEENAQTKKVETTSKSEITELACSKESYNDPGILVGQTQITQSCVNGKKTTVYTLTVKEGVEVSRVVASESITLQPVTERTAIGTKQPPSPPPPKSNCDPNYSGCVPIASDVDCASGSGNGPAYVQGPVRVIGSDIYRLDGDGDGVGCE